MTLLSGMRAHGLESAMKTGLRALGADSSRVSVSSPTRAVESIFLDEALRTSDGQGNRWDYGIGLKRGSASQTAWVEVHPASSSDVRDFLAKVAWLKQFLAQGGCGDCQRTSTFHWIATRGVSIDGARRRRLAMAGIAMPTKRLRL